MREAEAKKTEALKQKQKKEAALKQKKKKKKGLKQKKKKKGAALKLNEREGWNREFFSIYFPSNLLRKIMVISFMLDLILLVFRPLKTQLD